MASRFQFKYIEKRKTTIDLYHLTVIEVKILKDYMWQWVGVDNELNLVVSFNKKKNVKYEWYVEYELIMCGPPINGRSSPYIAYENYQLTLKYYGDGGLLLTDCLKIQNI